jgi:hypothetical protein
MCCPVYCHILTVIRSLNQSFTKYETSRSTSHPQSPPHTNYIPLIYRLPDLR